MVLAGPGCYAGEDRGKIQLFGDTDSKNAWFPLYLKSEDEVSLPSSAYEMSDKSNCSPQPGFASSEQQQLPHDDQITLWTTQAWQHRPDFKQGSTHRKRDQHFFLAESNRT